MSSLVDVVEATLCETHAAMDAGLPRGRVLTLPGLQVRISGLPVAVLNMAAHARMAANQEDAVDESLRCFASAGVPFCWWVSPRSTPSDLESRLAQRGLKLHAAMPAMHLDLAGWRASTPSVPLEIHSSREGPAFHEFLRIFQEAFQVPESMLGPWAEAYRAAFAQATVHPFVGRIEGAPVASGVLFLGTQAAALHSIGTLPGARGKGVGTAMTAALLAEAQRRGATAAVLESTPDGLGVYAALGFREVGTLRAYGP